MCVYKTTTTTETQRNGNDKDYELNVLHCFNHITVFFTMCANYILLHSPTIVSAHFIIDRIKQQNEQNGSHRRWG